MRSQPLELVHGSGDMVQMLEEALAQVKAGKVDGILLGIIGEDNHTLERAWREGMPFVQARFCHLERSSQWNSGSSPRSS